MGKLVSLLLLAAIAFTNLQAQNALDVIVEHDEAQPNTLDGEEIYKVVEEMPKFPGGEYELMKYLSSIIYPEQAIEDTLQGTVYIQFVVSKDGAVRDVVVVRPSNHAILDEAARNHVATMPNWQPGMQRGKTVHVQYVIPIRFKL